MALENTVATLSFASGYFQSLNKTTGIKASKIP